MIKFFKDSYTYKNYVPSEYDGEPPIDIPGSKEAISSMSKEMQTLFERLINLHIRYKQCTYPHTGCVPMVQCTYSYTGCLPMFPTEKYLAIKDVRHQRQQAETDFFEIEKTVRPMIQSKEEGSEYLFEKVCHIGTEMVCAIGQDVEYWQQCTEDSKSLAFASRRVTEINTLRVEHNQLLNRVANIKDLAALLVRREFPLKNGRTCFFPQASIPIIESLLQESSPPKHWIIQRLEAVPNLIREYFSRRFEKQEETRKKDAIKQNAAIDKRLAMLRYSSDNSFTSRAAFIPSYTPGFSRILH